MKEQGYDFDVIVVGGGIHGAGVTQALAAAGYSVLLVEKSEIGSGTSSKSSKLIHGGLRYLESMQFGLVKSCLAEREYLLQNAPDLVEMVPFYIPVYRSTQRRPWKISLGLYLYHFLSGFKSPFKRIPPAEWSALNGLSEQGLQAVFQYYDAQTDDVLLTQAVVKSAQSMGAKLMTSTQLLACQITNQGCDVDVETDQGTSRYRCRVMVNAAGAVVNDILALCSPKQKSLPIDLVQGTHILLDTPSKGGVFYLEAPADRRAVFAMPWKGKTLVGTTENKLDHYQDPPKPSQQEVDYLLDVYNAYFKNDQMSKADVIESFAGVRVLPRGDKSVFARARDTVLLVDSESHPRLVSIYGGKLTAYRATADKVLKKISVTLPAGRSSNVSTASLKLTDGK